MATLIKPNGEVTEVHPLNNEKTFSLEELQQYVGGYIEPVYFGDGRVMFIDEDGKSKNYEINQKATTMAQNFSRIAPWDYIVGTAIITEKYETN